MIDAWGKLPSGILSGNLYEIGNFDQCLEIDHSTKNFGQLNGQYCLTQLSVSANSSEFDLNKLLPDHRRIRNGDQKESTVMPYVIIESFLKVA